jgi:hypothetical protein
MGLREEANQMEDSRTASGWLRLTAGAAALQAGEPRRYVCEMNQRTSVDRRFRLHNNVFALHLPRLYQ